jgi:hypothetical protein
MQGRFLARLTCIIGARGTCKSTIVESIRFAFNLGVERIAELTGSEGMMKDTAAWTALRATAAALQMHSEEIRCLPLWIAIEALFGVNFEVKYRISQRLAFFIGNDRAEAHEIYSKAKKAYDFRSKMAHGSWKSDPSRRRFRPLRRVY